MTSELPAWDETARLPALATGTPAAATTRATAVEMLNVPRTSPPVPQVSMVPSGAVTASARERMARTKPASSPAVSPRAWRPTSMPPSCAGVTSPSSTASMKRSASSGASGCPVETERSAARTASAVDSVMAATPPLVPGTVRTGTVRACYPFGALCGHGRCYRARVSLRIPSQADCAQAADAR